MVQPAVCEIGTCGVIAIGRCTRCKLVFCTSHRATMPYGVGYTYVDMCSNCLWKEQEEQRNQQNQKKLKSEKARKYIVSGAARSDLRKAKVPTVAINEVTSKYKTFFGFKGHFIYDTKPFSFGWVLESDPRRFFRSFPNDVNSFVVLLDVSPDEVSKLNCLNDMQNHIPLCLVHRAVEGEGKYSYNVEKWVNGLEDRNEDNWIRLNDLIEQLIKSVS